MLTDEQLKIRMQGTGGSEIGAVAGLNPFMSPLHVYLSKVGEAPPFAGNEHTRRGDAKEAPIADWWANVVHATDVTSPGTLLSSRYPYVLSTPDRTAKLQGEPLACQVKAPTHKAKVNFGEPMTDQVPGYILAQCHWDMHAAVVERCHVAVEFGEEGVLTVTRSIYTVGFDPEFFGLLLEANSRLWVDHILKRVPPPADAPDGELLKYLHPRDNGAKLNFDAAPDLVEVVEALRRVRPQFRALEERHDALVNRVKQIMGDASHLETPYGGITWKSNRAGQVTDWKAVASEFRNLVALHATANPELRRLLSELDAVEKENTQTKPGARPFLVKLKEAA